MKLVGRTNSGPATGRICGRTTPPDWSASAAALAAHARETLAILDAIRDSRLLVAPVAEADRQRHMTGVALLEMIEVRLRRALADHQSRHTGRSGRSR